MEGVCFGFRAPPDGEAQVRCSRSQLIERRSLHADCAQHFFLHLCWRCMQERTFHCVQAHTGAHSVPAWIAALPGLECSGDCGRPTCAGHFRFLVSFRCKPGLRESSPDSMYERSFSEVGLCVCVSERQAADRSDGTACGGRPSTAGSGVSQPSAAVFRQNKNTPGFLLPGVFFIGDCEKLSWYRCSWSQAGCCRHR